MFKKIGIGLVALVVFMTAGAAIGIRATSTDTKNASSGQFTTASENASLQVKTFRTNDGVEDPINWLKGTNLVAYPDPAAINYGAIKVTNLNVSLTLFAAMRTINIGNTDGKNLAGRINTIFARPVSVAEQTTTPVTNTCGSSTWWAVPANYTNLTGAGPNATLANAPQFGDPAPALQAGDLTLTPGQSTVICVKTVYDPDFASLPPVFAATTSATFKFDASD